MMILPLLSSEIINRHSLTLDSIWQDLMETVVENRIMSLENFRIPISGSFQDVKMGGDIGDVIVVTWSKNIDALHKKIFGDTE